MSMELFEDRTELKTTLWIIKEIEKDLYAIKRGLMYKGEDGKYKKLDLYDIKGLYQKIDIKYFDINNLDHIILSTYDSTTFIEKYLLLRKINLNKNLDTGLGESVLLNYEKQSLESKRAIFEKATVQYTVNNF